MGDEQTDTKLEADAGGNVIGTSAIEVYGDGDVGLVRLALDPANSV